MYRTQLSQRELVRIWMGDSALSQRGIFELFEHLFYGKLCREARLFKVLIGGFAEIDIEPGQDRWRRRQYRNNIADGLARGEHRILSTFKTRDAGTNRQRLKSLGTPTIVKSGLRDFGHCPSFRSLL